MKNPIQQKVLISREQIATKLIEIAQELNRAYSETELLIFLVLKGAVCLGADLIRHLKIPFELEFIRCSSYGMNGMHRGTLSIEPFDFSRVRNRHILIVDDIFDTGTTLRQLSAAFEKYLPCSLRTLVLLEKKEQACPELKKPDYSLFKMDNLFVIGYGLDYKEKYRGLPDVCVLTESEMS